MLGPSLPPPTLVLDLDETLVHASVAPTPKDDFSFSFMFGGATHTMCAPLHTAPSLACSFLRVLLPPLCALANPRIL